ncbi:MAG TPA: hypothetical protein VLB86_08120 [Gaiellaceae bacterium]|nr:hypothetical protein [Gaiellaceae bacterium]
MRPLRVVVGLVLVVAATALALLAEDVRRWPGRVDRGDMRLAAGTLTPGAWTPDDALPLRMPSQRLGLADDLRYREALRLVRLTRTGLDSLDAIEVRRRQSRAEDALARVEERDTAAARRSRAATMRGVLLYEDALASGARSSDLLGRSIASLKRAIALDPANADAKLDLELLYNLQPPRQQRDKAGGGGGSTGGAAYSRPGEGY